MDIRAEWLRLMGANAGEIMAFTTQLVKEYWRLTEEKPWNWTALLDAYRVDAISGNYDYVISASAEFILQQTGIQLPCEYLLRNCAELER